MSHDHHLECRACGKVCEGGGPGGPSSDYSKFASWYGDGLIEHANVTKVLVGQGIGFSNDGQGWAWFVAEHAGCNAFYEVCEDAQYSSGGCDGYPRRILVKDAPEPPCKTCMGRGLVPCLDCVKPISGSPLKRCKGGPRASNHLGPLDLERDGPYVTCERCGEEKVFRCQEHLVQLGRVYLDGNKRRWACVDWSDSHGLIFLCVHIREAPRGDWNLGERVANPFDKYDTEWFEPDGTSCNGPHLRLVERVAHGPHYLPQTEGA